MSLPQPQMDEEIFCAKKIKPLLTNIQIAFNLQIFTKMGDI